MLSKEVTKSFLKKSQKAVLKKNSWLTGIGKTSFKNSMAPSSMLFGDGYRFE
jgi:hypothetical protein